MNQLTHFAIHASDVERAKQFYSRVFDWQFGSYPGASDFYQVHSSDGGNIGAIQARHFSPIAAEVLGFECSIAVDDIDAATEKIEKAGGKVLLPKSEIGGVGWVAKFADTEGNLFCAIQYRHHSK